MYVPSNTPKYVCYQCRNKISIEDLEGIFHEQLKSFFFSPSEIADYLNKADTVNTVIKEKEELVKKLETEQRKLECDIDKLYELYFSDQITKKEFGKKYRPLEDRRKQLEEEIPAIQGEMDFLKIQYLSSEQIVTEARDLYREWPKLPIEIKRRVVENITESLVIGTEEVTINRCDLPSSAK